ncbi:erythromycin esterase family protein [Actinomadura sp. WAC 06369]|uniref:erythromycin esterase family protein n=1 Tax=Actinomadura sp. WAC 06369 TaxID=2203193 RepID=UPI000F76D703|nr:erythromycin esterase family protein [Actinomadura sp. WAC 06369]RSN52513.1 erythromycin esterase [Actinomadura sp. WAC 06369]
MSVHDIGLHFGDDLAGLGSALDRLLDGFRPAPALLALGEPTHGAEEFPRLRNQVLRHLVEHHGYRSIAIESDHIAGTVVDDHVATGAGDLDDVLAAGFTHEFGTLRGNRELLAWLREHNAGADPEERVRFYGFDGPFEITGAPSPRASLTAAHAYLAEHLPRVPYDAGDLDALLGDDDAWTHPEVMMDPAHSIGDTPEARRLRLLADDVLSVYGFEAPTLIAATSDDAYFRAHAHARTARAVLRYHAVLASVSPARMPTLLGLRDALMAEHLRAIAAAEERRGPCLVFAHNAHVQRARSHMPWWGEEDGLHWWSAGALTAASDLGGRYRLIVSEHGGDGDADDSLQGVLAGAVPGRAFFPAAPLADALADARDLRVPSRQGHIPLEAAELRGADAVAFVRVAG